MVFMRVVYAKGGGGNFATISPHLEGFFLAIFRRIFRGQVKTVEFFFQTVFVYFFLLSE